MDTDILKTIESRRKELNVSIPRISRYAGFHQVTYYRKLESGKFYIHEVARMLKLLKLEMKINQIEECE